MKNLRQERIGLVFKTKSGHTFEIVDYYSANDVIIIFNCGNKITTRWDHINNGLVKYPNNKSNCGVGFMGFGSHSSKSSKESYLRWDKMLSRVYRKECQGYENCVVDKRWHNFQTFSDWFYREQDSLKRDVGGKPYCLDKDILGDGLVYSPENCCFVPESLNKIITNTKHALGAYVNGDKFMVRTRQSGVVGSYGTVVEANIVYKKTKIKDILNTASKECYERQDVISKLLGKFV